MEQSSTSSEVLNKLKRDGHIEQLCEKVVNRIKANGDLRNYIVSKVEQSFSLSKPGAETMDPEELFDAILDEIKNPVLEKISEATWKVLDSKDELGKEVNETCERVYLQISDRKHKESPPQEICSSDSQEFVDQEPAEPPGFSCYVGQKFAGCDMQRTFSYSFEKQFMDWSVQKLGGRVNKEMSESSAFSVATDHKLFCREPEGYSNEIKPMEPSHLGHVNSHHPSCGRPMSHDPVLSYRQDRRGGRGDRKRPRNWRGNNPAKLHYGRNNSYKHTPTTGN